MCMQVFVNNMTARQNTLRFFAKWPLCMLSLCVAGVVSLGLMQLAGQLQIKTQSSKWVKYSLYVNIDLVLRGKYLHFWIFTHIHAA